MCLDMFVKMTFLGESLGTCVTTKWFFPLNGILCEYLGAYLAPVRLLPTVYPHMSLKVTWCYRSKLTQCAPVWPLPCVSHHVSP